MRPMIYTGYQWRPMKDDEIEIMCSENIVVTMPRYPEAGGSGMNSGLIGMLGELEREYKRVVALGSIRNGRAYWKGYLTALSFAMNVIKANEVDAE